MAHTQAQPRFSVITSHRIAPRCEENEVLPVCELSSCTTWVWLLPRMWHPARVVGVPGVCQAVDPGLACVSSHGVQDEGRCSHESFRLRRRILQMEHRECLHGESSELAL